MTYLVFLYHGFLTLLYFFTFLISVCSFYTFGTTCSRLAKTILKLSIQILKVTTYFVKRLSKCKINLYNTPRVQYNYLWMITNKNRLKSTVNITSLKNFYNFILAASIQRACVYLCLDFRTKNKAFDRNKRDTEIFHSF